MKLRNTIIAAAAALTLSTAVQAQDIEGGIFLGVTNYQGDLTKQDVTLKETKPNIGLLGRYYFGPRFDLKGTFNYGYIAGRDANYDDQSKDYGRFRSKRNADFTSNIFEASLNAEVNILPFISNSRRYRFAPYVFGGIALYHFNPRGYTTSGDKVDLQPLGTEGQTLDAAADRGSKDQTGPYKRWQGAIPYGIGIKYSLGNFWNIGLEIGQRKLFTDYLDDVSQDYAHNAAALKAKSPLGYDVSFGKSPSIAANQAKGITPQGRGNSKDNDMYVFIGFTLTKTLRRFSCTNF